MAHAQNQMDEIDVSIVMAVHNAEKWLDETLKSVVDQTFGGTLELSIYLDSCTDRSELLVNSWRSRLEERGIELTLTKSESTLTKSESLTSPRGVGYSKNIAVTQSTGKFLCFLDADDVMLPDRIQKQHKMATLNAIVGCKFHRDPEGSTHRYTHWANHLRPHQLYTQVYTSHGPTVIMPTWFCDRRVYERVGQFDERGLGVPEDLLFFYEHLRQGGEVLRVDEDLLMYRYHSHNTTFSITEDTIWREKLQFLEEQILSSWNSFTIWNAGKQGRKFYRSLSPQSKAKVVEFCDVDVKKIEQAFYTHQESLCIPRDRYSQLIKQEWFTSRFNSLRPSVDYLEVWAATMVLPKPTVPIVHFTLAKPPFIICMKLGLTGGEFEMNLSSLNLTEGEDYYHFN